MQEVKFETSFNLFKTIGSSIIVIVFTFSSIVINEIESKNQYVQPLNMGMQVAIPYDIANIFNRPVWFGRTASLFLSGCILFILFFGVITSPFGYMFGIPSEKYVLGQTWGSLSGFDATKDKAPSRNMNISDFDSGWVDENNYEYVEEEENIDRNYRPSPRSLSTSYYSGDFIESMFYWMPTVRDDECKKLMLCYGHKTFHHVPDVVLTVFRFFSKRLLRINDEFKEAIYAGLKSDGQNEPIISCEEHFPNCPETVFGILVRSAVGLMPKWTRKKALKRNEYF